MSVRKLTGQIFLAPGNPVLWMESAANLSVSFFSESNLEKVLSHPGYFCCDTEL